MGLSSLVLASPKPGDVEGRTQLPESGALPSCSREGVAVAIWTEFRGDRGTKSKPIPGPHLVYGFLTTALNAIVEPIHPKAMPVILTAGEEPRRLDARAVGWGEGAAAANYRMTR
jgi:hypothetical protein